MKKKTLLTPQQEELLKNLNKNYDNKNTFSLNENERIKKDFKNHSKNQLHRGSNRGR